MPYLWPPGTTKGQSSTSYSKSAHRNYEGSDDEEQPRKRRAIATSDTLEPSQPPPSPQPGPSQGPQSSLQDPPRVPGFAERDMIEDEGESDPNFKILSQNQRHIQDFEKHGRRLHVYNRASHRTPYRTQTKTT